MNIIIDTLNATTKFMLTEKIGYDETGIWVGAYGSIINEHVDIATTPYFILLHRLHLLDYIDTLGTGRAYFVFRFPNLSSVANIYVLPFSRLVWICLVICAILCVIATYFILKFEDKIIKNSQKNSISDIALMTFSAICQMGSEIEAKLFSSRIFYFFLYITFVFVYTSYTANIVALLQTPTKSIQTLEDLYNSKLKLGVEDNLYNRYYMPRTTDPIRLKIYREKIAPPNSPPNFVDLKTGVALLRNSSYAYFAEGGSLYTEMERTFFEGEKCNLNEIEYLEIIDPYQALKKNSPFREIMKTNLPKLREFGIQKVEVNRMITKRPQCVVASGSQFESVSLESVRGAILLLPFGALMATILFAGEMLRSLTIKRKIYNANPKITIDQ
ncbi:probable glutamate receptor [Culicoides brevitarsis]|uniref:probable glutamate receptor n=1 Tax=Culicoides brevitarsis TaxID=469753 RepID=UPI00307B512B